MEEKMKEVSTMTDGEAMHELLKSSMQITEPLLTVVNADDFASTVDINGIILSTDANKRQGYNAKGDVIAFVMDNICYITPRSAKREEILNKLGVPEVPSMPVPLRGLLPADKGLRAFWLGLLETAKGEDTSYMENVYRQRAAESGKTTHLSAAMKAKCFPITGEIKSSTGVIYEENFYHVDTKFLGSFCQIGETMAVRDIDGHLFITRDKTVKRDVMSMFDCVPQKVPFYIGEPADTEAKKLFAEKMKA